MTLCLLAVGSSAQAKDWQVQLGVGAYVSNSPYIGTDADPVFGPIATFAFRGLVVGTTGVQYRRGGFELTLDSATFELEATDHTKLRFGIVSRGSPYDASASPGLSGMARDGWVEAVLGLTHAMSDATSVSFSLGRDIGHVFDGAEATATVTSALSLGPVPLEAGFGLNWKSAAMTNHLYGVTPAEARAGRPAYAPGASFTPMLSLRSAVPLSENSAAFTELRIEALGAPVSRSPIVANSLVGSFTFGIGVQF